MLHHRSFLILALASLLLKVVGTSTSPPSPLCSTQYPGYIDIRSVPADLFVPNISASFSQPMPGNRVLVSLPNWLDGNLSAAYFMLYLPTDFVMNRVKPYPVIIELPGNGPYSSPWGDTSNGRPDDTFLGYGISEGRGAIWAAVPFLTSNGLFDQTYWWGCPINNTEGGFSPQPPPVWMNNYKGCLNSTDTTKSREYLRAVVAYVITTFNGDASRVVLAGFSRGAIGVNYIGLGDDETAAIWRGSIAYAHYDGQAEDLRWPYPDNNPDAAYARLKRLGARPQFVCSELDSTFNQTKPFIDGAGFFVNVTYAPTGFCNHNSEWVLRPSKARDMLREWYNNNIVQ